MRWPAGRWSSWWWCVYWEGRGRAGTAGPAPCMTVRAPWPISTSAGGRENFRSPVREKSYREEVGRDRKRARFEQQCQCQASDTFM